MNCGTQPDACLRTFCGLPRCSLPAPWSGRPSFSLPGSFWLWCALHYRHASMLTQLQTFSMTESEAELKPPADPESPSNIEPAADLRADHYPRLHCWCRVDHPCIFGEYTGFQIDCWWGIKLPSFVEEATEEATASVTGNDSEGPMTSTQAGLAPLWKAMSSSCACLKQGRFSTGCDLYSVNHNFLNRFWASEQAYCSIIRDWIIVKNW